MQKRGEAMQMISLEQELKQNAYPGRGIVIGQSANGKYAVLLLQAPVLTLAF